jgi:hypothetical protein
MFEHAALGSSNCSGARNELPARFSRYAAREVK